MQVIHVSGSSRSGKQFGIHGSDVLERMFMDIREVSVLREIEQQKEHGSCFALLKVVETASWGLYLHTIGTQTRTSEHLH